MTQRAMAARSMPKGHRPLARLEPAELREEAVAFANAQHALGQRYKPIAKALGDKAETLMRWCRASREPKFARVVVKPAAPEHLTVHGPAGTRIEQLSIEQVVELFGALSWSGRAERFTSGCTARDPTSLTWLGFLWVPRIRLDVLLQRYVASLLWSRRLRTARFIA